MQIPSIAPHPATADPVLRTMFEARKRVFVDLLKWEVPVLEDRYEIDQFDTEDAVYIVLTDNEGRHRASMRILHTDGPHILKSLFPVLSDGPIPVGASVREITRFCIEPSLLRHERRLARNELVSAIARHAMTSGISAYTAVATRGWYRQIAGFGWRCTSLGDGRTIGGEDLVALQITITPQTIDHLSAAGIFREADFNLVESGLELAA